MATATLEKETERATFNPSWAEMLRFALTAPGKAGNTYNRFRNYSIGNQMLLQMQGLFEPVHTYKGWQSLGRQVRKGSKAAVIWRPLFRKAKDKDGNLTEEQELSGFKLVPCVFGVSATDGEDLPAWEPPEWSQSRALEKLGVSRVTFSLLNGNVQGYSVGKELAVSPVANYPLKTLVHELAHIVAGHTTGEAWDEYQTHRGLKEFEAEGAAYLVMSELGAEHWDPAESRAYIQTWLEGQTPDDKSIRRVFATADKIYRAGLVEAEELAAA